MKEVLPLPQAPSPFQELSQRGLFCGGGEKLFEKSFSPPPNPLPFSKTFKEGNTCGEVRASNQKTAVIQAMDDSHFVIFF
ncbi:MAG: hypothetical protein IJX19_12055 [Clostridia bacterium]|nr:hypothetical protein [Clostridia bacterium]